MICVIYVAVIVIGLELSALPMSFLTSVLLMACRSLDAVDAQGIISRRLWIAPSSKVHCISLRHYKIAVDEISSQLDVLDDSVHAGSLLLYF